MSLFAAAGCTNAGGPPQTDEPSVTFTEASLHAKAARFSPVVNANPRVAGLSSPSVLPPEFFQAPLVQGATPVENPQTVTLAGGTTATVTHYGYLGDGPLLPAAGDLPSATHKVEASKTEPDKNTYLVLYGQTGPDAAYDYGTHFLFQGHEQGAPGLLTRVNLDADGPHKVTLMAATDATGAPLADIDGSTWDPFAQRLVLTTENAGAATYQATVTFPSVVEDISGAVGRGGYEGVQNDAEGNLWIVEDIGGSRPAATPHSKVASSFVYRFVKKHKDKLTEGKLQVLQATSLRTGNPITFQSVDAGSADMLDLHAYGTAFATTWVTIHDTDVDGTAPFNANALAKSKNTGTPFKRPENGQFRPGTHFREFYFSETGDTDARTEVGAAAGGFGSVLKLVQKSASASTGTLSLVYLGDVVHNGFDNCAFVSRNKIVFGEDAGDTMHGQRNGLDSAYLVDVTADYSKGAQPPRLLAEGRDASATLDAGFSGLAGFQNDGDNELTGIHVSNGDPSPRGLLGASIPRPFRDGWRVFYTQQHGDNVIWEIGARPGSETALDD
ncbi:MAG TPA: phosphatase [Polyangia bacterium]|nr:phosphatase [Polyangia bacterium]